MSTSRLFDLNIEDVLEHWTVPHALREIISNALDEQLLTGSDAISIEHTGCECVIRDYGRGIRIEHFTLNEDPEKLQGPEGIIGKFGVGLKDALATFDRHGVEVEIRSSYGQFRLESAHKHNFEGIRTLHVRHEPGVAPMAGTEVSLKGITSAQLDEAKSYFLEFSSDRVIERTPYGQIVGSGDRANRVYINGVLAAEEPGFLFSYNITSLTARMRKSLNRERINVGRSTYTDRVKAILRSADSDDVKRTLADWAGKRRENVVPDEFQWIDIAALGLSYLAEQSDVIYLTQEQYAVNPDLVDSMRHDGYDVCFVSLPELNKLEDQRGNSDAEIHTLDTFIEEFNASFQYAFVDPDELDPPEKNVFKRTAELLRLVGSNPIDLPVRISETIRINKEASASVWDSERQEIIIKRSQLTSLDSYAAGLLHSVAHATSGRRAATRSFEAVLTDYLGLVAAKAVSAAPDDPNIPRSAD